MMMVENIMFAWQVLDDCILHGRSLTESDKAELELAKTILAQEYVTRTMGRLRVGLDKNDAPQEGASDILKQRIIAFNQGIGNISATFMRAPGNLVEQYQREHKKE